MELVDLLRGLFWLIQHPLTALKRTAAVVGGAAVGCLAMAAVFLVAIALSGFIHVGGEGSLWYGATTLAVASGVAVVAVRFYLPRVPDSWRWSDEPEPAAPSVAVPRQAADHRPQAEAIIQMKPRTPTLEDEARAVLERDRKRRAVSHPARFWIVFLAYVVGATVNFATLLLSDLIQSPVGEALLIVFSYVYLLSLPGGLVLAGVLRALGGDRDLARGFGFGAAFGLVATVVTIVLAI